jgi:hypothetical protein
MTNELLAKIKEAIRLSDNVGRSRGMNNYATNTTALTKLLDLEEEIKRDLAALASQGVEPAAWDVRNAEISYRGIFATEREAKATADQHDEAGYSQAKVTPLYARHPAPPAGISPAPLAGEWRPIETAPRSVQPILVLKEGRRMAIETGHYAHNMMHAAKVDGEECGFTHWMPLPAAPRAALSQGDVSGEGAK